MFLGFVFIIGGLGTLMLLERIYPDRDLPRVPGWWMRVLTINLSQLCIVVLGAYTWEYWLHYFIPSIFELKKHVGPPLGGFIAYLVNSYIFYWFHRARHEIYLFWILFHQLHHSPQRIEVITSFYKHPLEILVDSILMTCLLYPILGLSTQSSIWLSIFSAYGEYFYHMNMKTPYWIGYFFQRPESHRVHHMRNQREDCMNYSDFPLWDWLGCTFFNPPTDVIATGFSAANESRFTEMLMFKDVLAEQEPSKEQDQPNWSELMRYKILPVFLLLLGIVQPIGYLFNQPQIRGLGIVSTASPLPLVFSAYNGVETYATSFHIDLFHSIDSMNKSFPLTRTPIKLNKSVYSEIKGPYNRRNVFGAILSHGPFFTGPKLITLRNRVLDYMICKNKLALGKDLLPNHPLTIIGANITIKSYSQKQTWIMEVKCMESNLVPSVKVLKVN